MGMSNSTWARLSFRLLVCSCFASSLAHAAVLYTFSNTGSQPYSFSFLEPDIITAPGDVAIPPFTIGTSSFTQAAFGVECIAIAGAAGFVDGGIGGCDVGSGSNGSAWLITNPPLNHPGTYSILGTSLGEAPPAPDHVTISEVPAYSYTFSNTGSQPYSFTFLEQNLLTAPGVFAVPPFTVDGSTFTQAAFNPECFSFATASGLVDASVSGCDVSSGWLIDSPGAIKPGAYHSFRHTRRIRSFGPGPVDDRFSTRKCSGAHELDPVWMRTDRSRTARAAPASLTGRRAMVTAATWAPPVGATAVQADREFVAWKASCCQY